MDQASLRPLTKPRVGDTVQALFERTFAWLGRCRRLGKDFEATFESALAWLHVANIKLLTRKLART